MDMAERKELIRIHLKSRHGESWEILQALLPEHTGELVYSHESETWTVHQVLAHLADSESGLQLQIRRLAEGEDGVPANFDLARWNRSAVRKRADLSLDELRGQVVEAHDQALDLLDELDEGSLDNRGFVSTGEVLSVQDLFMRIADHRLEHATDIQRAIEGEA
jgi:hypothetical protein